MLRTLARFIVAGAVLCLLAFPASATADITRFDLSGIITDGTGGVLPGVTVSLRNTDTGFTRSTVTDSGGRYSFNALPPTGKWTLTAELEGFRTQNHEGLEFQANTRPEINFQLNVGGVQESITVAASSPLVRTRESELSSILDAKQVDALQRAVVQRPGHPHGELRRRRCLDDRP
jgi:Carboxypeptidase regulatory-like domain